MAIIRGRVTDWNGHDIDSEFMKGVPPNTVKFPEPIRSAYTPLACSGHTWNEVEFSYRYMYLRWILRKFTTRSSRVYGNRITRFFGKQMVRDSVIFGDSRGIWFTLDDHSWGRCRLIVKTLSATECIMCAREASASRRIVLFLYLLLQSHWRGIFLP